MLIVKAAEFLAAEVHGFGVFFHFVIVIGKGVPRGAVLGGSFRCGFGDFYLPP